MGCLFSIVMLPFVALFRIVTLPVMVLRWLLPVLFFVVILFVIGIML